MEYKIISGKVIEIRRSFLQTRDACEPKRRRSARVAGHSSESKIKRNERECVRECARVINCNFQAGDLHCVLKYEDGKLPGSYEEAEGVLKKWIGAYRRAFLKETGRAPKMLWVTANFSPKRKAPARIHHHVVIEREGLEIASRLWTGGGFATERLDSRVDHSDLAAYLVENVYDRPAKRNGIAAGTWRGRSTRSRSPSRTWRISTRSAAASSRSTRSRTMRTSAPLQATYDASCRSRRSSGAEGSSYQKAGRKE